MDGTVLGGVCPSCLLGVATDVAVPELGEDSESRAGSVAIPGFEVERQIGRGGMGEVYLARQRSLDREVAIKVIGPALAGDASLQERFLREAQVLAKVRHPNVVTIHDSGRTEDGELYFIMEHVPGRDLASVMKEESGSPERVRAIFGAICSAVEAAHAQGIVHRDLKPANVLLSERGEVKVSDFGLARRRMDTAEAGASSAATPVEPFSDEDSILPLTQPDAAIGTPGYRAPEAEVSERSDVFSLGVMLGQLAKWSGDRALRARIRSVVQWATHAEPEARPATVRQLWMAVHRALSSWWRSRWFAASAGLSVLVLLAGWLVGGGESDRPDGVAALPKVGAIQWRGELINGLATDEDRLAALLDARQICVSARGWLALREEGYLVGSRRWRKLPERAESIGVTQRGLSGLFAVDQSGWVHFMQERDWMDVPESARRNVADLDAGTGHGLTLHRDGSVTVWGAAVEAKGPEIPAEWLTEVAAIAALRDHALVLSQEGVVRGWGALGLVDEVVFDRLEPGEEMVAMEGGRRELVLLTDRGRVLSWDVQTRAQEWVRLPQGRHAVRLVASWDCYAAQLEDGSWHLWGEGWDAGIRTELRTKRGIIDLSFSGLRHEDRGLPGSTVAAWIEAPMPDAEKK